MPGDETICINSLKQTRNQEYFVLGCSDGTLRLHPTGDWTKHFSIHAHDATTGQVLVSLTSFDDSHALSIGSDGNFFVFRSAFNGDPIPVRYYPCYFQSVVLWSYS
jgi:hypothetical protein